MVILSIVSWPTEANERGRSPYLAWIDILEGPDPSGGDRLQKYRSGPGASVPHLGSLAGNLRACPNPAAPGADHECTYPIVHLRPA
jgi:hypothetical protein